MKNIRIILIEDNRLLREGITAMLKKEQDISVVTALDDKNFSLKKLDNLKLDIVLMDFGLPHKNSFELLKSIKNKYQDLKIIIMGFIPIHDDILQFVKLGASGFIMKEAGVSEFVSTIRSVYEGNKILPDNLVGSLFSQILTEAVNGPRKSRLNSAVRLTKRERQVIAFVSDGLTNKEIGLKLHLSPFTVKSHIHNILEKLAIHNRIEIAKFAHTDEDFKKMESTVSIMEDN